MEDLTGFQRDLLYVIAGLGDPHGLAIKKDLEGEIQRLSPAAGLIWRILLSSTRA